MGEVMKKKVKTIGIDLLLLGIVLFLSLLFHAVFIAGPLRAMEHEDKLFVETFVLKEDLENTEYLNRFSLKNTYYILKDKENLYYFDQDYKESGSHQYIPLTNAYEKAQELGFKKKDVSYGVYDEKIVFNLERKNHVVFLDLETLEVVFEFGG